MSEYVEALGYLYGLSPRGIRLELDRMRQALALRGHPESQLRVVHVAGTNGKGSVAAMVAEVLTRAGIRTGLYTSPHLHRFVERIRVDGRPAEEAEVARAVQSIRATLSEPRAPELTFFETTTLLAFELFRARGCEIVVIEVGLGGRLDATNVVEAPEVCAITRIGLEHTDRLGRTLEEVAREKAGILKAGVPAVVGPQEPESTRAIVERAREVGAPLSFVEARAAGELGLAGAHQRENAAVAVAVLAILEANGYPIEREAVNEGLRAVRWPGRLELIEGDPPVLLDAAHNPDGCRSLARYLGDLPRHGRRVLVFGAMADKDHEAMLAALDEAVDERIYASPAVARAASPESLSRVRPGHCAGGIAEAVAEARRTAGEGGLVIAAGSIFLMAEVRAHLLGCPADPPIAM